MYIEKSASSAKSISSLAYFVIPVIFVCLLENFLNDFIGAVFQWQYNCQILIRFFNKVILTNLQSLRNTDVSNYNLWEDLKFYLITTGF